MKKINFWKYCPILFTFLVLNGCLSGSRPDVKLSPKIDERVHQLSPLYNTVGIYIDPALRNYVQKEKLTHYNIGIHNYTFPIGQSLAPKIEEMSKLIFNKVIVLDNLQGNKEPLDGIVTFSMKSSEIELQEGVLASCRDDLHRKIVAMRTDGYTHEEIAGTCLMSKSGITYRIRRIGERLVERCPEYRQYVIREDKDD